MENMENISAVRASMLAFWLHHLAVKPHRVSVDLLWLDLKCFCLCLLEASAGLSRFILISKTWNFQSRKYGKKSYSLCRFWRWIPPMTISVTNPDHSVCHLHTETSRLIFISFTFYFFVFPIITFFPTPALLTSCPLPLSSALFTSGSLGES